MFALEKELNLLFSTTDLNINNINNSKPRRDSTASRSSLTLITFRLLDGSDNSINLNQNDSSLTLTDNNQSDHVPSIPAMKDEETILLAPQENSQQQCDDNQNNMNNRMVSNGSAAASERIRVNLKQLLALYAKLKRQLVEFTEAKANEQSSYKAKCDEMSSQVRKPHFRRDSPESECLSLSSRFS
jgi:hypothetical protein